MPTLVLALSVGCIERVPSADPDALDAAGSDVGGDVGRDLGADGGAVTDATRPTDGSQPPDPPDQSRPCVPPVFNDADVRSATFLGPYLYVDGPAGVTVGRVEPPFVVPIGVLETLTEGTPADAPERATFLPLGGGRYGRVTVDEAGRPSAETFDFSDPLAPRRLSVLADDDLQRPHAAVGATEGRLVLCVGGELALVDPERAETLRLPTRAGICGRAGLAIAGPQVVSWDQGRGALVPSFQLNTVVGGGLTSLLDFGFNPSGSHRYGDIVTAAVGPRHALIDVRSSRYSWLLNLTGEGNVLNELDFPLEGDPPLLGFVGDLVLRGSARGLVSIDVSDLGRPQAGPSWPMEPGEEAPRLLAVGETHFAVRGADGGLLVLPRAGGDPLRIEGCP